MGMGTNWGRRDLRPRVSFLIVWAALLAISIAPVNADIPYVIETNADGQAMYQQVRVLVAAFGVTSQDKVTVAMASPDDLARVSGMNVEMMKSFAVYSRGQIILYMLCGINRDQFTLEAAQTITRSWLSRYAPREQSQNLQEGFAMLVGYHALQKAGAYRAADEMLRIDDPRSYGMRRLLNLEEQQGWSAVLEFMRTSLDIPG